ncbi:MAG: hypothetical protein ABIN08_12785 [Caldimonas sp.]
MEYAAMRMPKPIASASGDGYPVMIFVAWQNCIQSGHRSEQ